MRSCWASSNWDERLTKARLKRTARSTFLRIDSDELLEVIKNAKSDDEIYAYLRPFVEKKSDAEIQHWNREWVTRQPEGKSLEYFLELRNTITPQRTDITSWPDLLDLDETRDVPERQPIAA
jgi:Domain of unknown function (DUF5069)